MRGESLSSRGGEKGWWDGSFKGGGGGVNRKRRKRKIESQILYAIVLFF